jgi:hypothetical protein
MARLKKHYSEISIDSATGEVIDEKVHRYLIDNDTEFYITYCKVLGLMENMGLGEIKTLAWLVSHLQFNNNMISASIGVKRKIAEDMKIGVNSVNNALVKLVKCGVLYRDDNSSGRDAIYYIHPEYFWKGEVSERNRKLKYVLEFGLVKKDLNK